MKQAALSFTWQESGHGIFHHENMSRDAWVILATLAIEKLRKVAEPTQCACEICERMRLLLAVPPPDLETSPCTASEATH